MSANRGSLYVCDMMIREKIAMQAFSVLLGIDQQDNGLGFNKDLADVKRLAKSACVAADTLLAELAKPQDVAP